MITSPEIEIWLYHWVTTSTSRPELIEVFKSPGNIFDGKRKELIFCKKYGLFVANFKHNTKFINEILEEHGDMEPSEGKTITKTINL